MALHVDDQVGNEMAAAGTQATDRNLGERHLFQTIEHIGKQDHGSEWKQRLAAIVLAIVICAALYGGLFLATHFYE